MDETQVGLKRFSAADVALGDGKEGRPALIVYKGQVYDVTGSKLWRNGVHVKAHTGRRRPDIVAWAPRRTTTR